MADSSLGDLFDWKPPAPSTPKPAEPEQHEQLARVVSTLEPHVMAFLRQCMRSPESCLFHGKTLLKFVHERQRKEGVAEDALCAPDSPRRTMKELEEQGCCQVLLRSKRRSLFEVVCVSEDPQ